MGAVATDGHIAEVHLPFIADPSSPIRIVVGNRRIVHPQFALVPNTASKRTRGHIVDNRTPPHSKRCATIDQKSPSTRKGLVLPNNEVVKLGRTGIDSDPSSALTAASLHSDVIQLEAFVLDIKHTIGMVAVDDGGGGTRTLNLHAVRNCEMPSPLCHWKGELIEPTGNFDRVFPHRSIRFHHGGAQRAQTTRRSGLGTRRDRPRARAITRIRIRRIRQTIDSIRHASACDERQQNHQ